MATHANPGQHLNSKGVQFSPTFLSGHTEGELDGISEDCVVGAPDGESEGTPDGLNAGCVLGTPDGASEGEANGDSLGDVDGRAVPGLVGDAVTVGFLVGGGV